MQSVAFQLGGFTIYWYGILAALGFLVGFWTAARRAPRWGLNAAIIADLAPWLIISAVLGARLVYVITYWRHEFAHLDHPFLEIFKIRSGLVFYGGLIGACVGTWLFSIRHRQPLWKLADALAPSIALGHAFGRIGCFMTGCCYGTACEGWWAVHFPVDHATGGTGVHPTQLYESLLNVLLFVWLERLHRRRKFTGQVFATYLIGYAVLRTAAEFFRGDYAHRFLSFFSPAQIVSPLILAAGIILWRVLRPRELSHMSRPT